MPILRYKTDRGGGLLKTLQRPAIAFKMNFEVFSMTYKSPCDLIF